MHDCPNKRCDESFYLLPELRDHLMNNHRLGLIEAKDAVFGEGYQ